MFVKWYWDLYLSSFGIVFFVLCIFCKVIRIMVLDVFLSLGVCVILVVCLWLVVVFDEV